MGGKHIGTVDTPRLSSILSYNLGISGKSRVVKREVRGDKNRDSAMIRDRTGKDREVLNQIKVNSMTMFLPTICNVLQSTSVLC